MSEPRVVRICMPESDLPASLDRCSGSEWRAAVDGPLEFVIEQAQQAVLDLLSEGGGVVMIVAALPRNAAEQTAIAGLHGLTRSIAKEYGSRKIRCNLLVGGGEDLERVLTSNSAITGELLVAGDRLVGAAGLDGATQ